MAQTPIIPPRYIHALGLNEKCTIIGSLLPASRRIMRDSTKPMPKLKKVLFKQTGPLCIIYAKPLCFFFEIGIKILGA